MAFSQSDLDALDKAIATGAMEVRYSDGRQVRYRSLAELRNIRDQIRTELGLGTAPRVTLAEHKR